MFSCHRPDQLERIGVSHVMERCLPLTPYGLEEKRAVELFAPERHQELQLELEAVAALVRVARDNPGWVEEVELILGRFREVRGTLRKLGRSGGGDFAGGSGGRGGGGHGVGEAGGLEVGGTDHGGEAGGGDSVDEMDCYELKGFAIHLADLLQRTKEVGFHLAGIHPTPLPDLISLLNPEGLPSRSFSISDSYSAKLSAIRAEKRKREHILLSAGDDATQEVGKERLRLVEQERHEEDRVRRLLTSQLRPFVASLQVGCHFTGRFDFLLAKARLAVKLGGAAPRITGPAGRRIVMEEAVNPLVAAQLERNCRRFTPISITLEEGASVITGANMGGKSVVLATLTLNSLLSLSGFFPFARRMELPHLDFVFHLGDDLPFGQLGLSSFGNEVNRLGRLLQLMRKGSGSERGNGSGPGQGQGPGRGVAAIDEFARATNPDEGEALMRGLLQYLARHDSFCLASTHYRGVVGQGMAHFQVMGLRNTPLETLKGCLAANRAENGMGGEGKVRAGEYVGREDGQSFMGLQEYMDYRLTRVEWDVSPPREALRVAELLGLDDELLRLARHQLDGNDSKGPVEEPELSKGE